MLPVGSWRVCLEGKAVISSCRCAECCRRLLIEVDVEDAEREPVKAFVPGWPWTPVARLLRVLPLSVVRRLTGS